MNDFTTPIPPPETAHLTRVQLAGTVGVGPVAISISHNEGVILPQFLDHYRMQGVAHFIIVDDHSTDDTDAILTGQTDVTVYRPKPESTFGDHKSPWRCDVLDGFADGAWVMLPDIDEHIVYASMEERSLTDLIAHLEDEGAQAMFAIMVDMFSDSPLGEQSFDGGTLAEVYPLFDGPQDPVDGMRLLPPARRFLKKYPTPPVCAYGGVRDRMCFRRDRQLGWLGRALLRRYAHIDRPLEPTGMDVLTNGITRRVVKRWLGEEPFQMTKIALVKWQRSMRVPGGPHALNRKVRLSETSAAYLHYKFVGGVTRFEYNSERGQHAAGGLYYQQIVNAKDALSVRPTTNSTRRFAMSRDFEDIGLIRRGTWE